MRDELGARMKVSYELPTRFTLPRRTYTLIRLDGRAFHTYTRGLQRPFDVDLHEDLVESTRTLCANVQGCRLAYVQSDEVTLVLSDVGQRTEPWFGGVVQKMCSVSASTLTATFNALRRQRDDPEDPRGAALVATFDARVFTVPDLTEVVNNLIWRQADARRNSIAALAQAHFSPRQLHGKSGDELRELLWTERHVDWNDSDPRFKHGTLLYPELRVEDVRYVDRRTNELRVAYAVERRHWVDEAAPVFVLARDTVRGYVTREQLSTTGQLRTVEDDDVKDLDDQR